MNLLRNHGLELPIYGLNTPLVPPYRTHDLAPGVTHFVRPVSVRPAPPGLSLKEILHHADIELSKIARLRGLPSASVVDYEWGLYETIDASREEYGVVPKGFRLVAQVARIIPDYSRPESQQADDNHAIYQALKKSYYSTSRLNPRRRKPIKLSDMSSSQFLFGVPAADPAQEAKYWMVDIEPRLRYY